MLIFRGVEYQSLWFFVEFLSISPVRDNRVQGQKKDSANPDPWKSTNWDQKILWATLMCWDSTSKQKHTLKFKFQRYNWIAEISLISTSLLLVMTSHPVGRILPHFCLHLGVRFTVPKKATTASCFFLRTLPSKCTPFQEASLHLSGFINLHPFMTLQYSWGSGASFHVSKKDHFKMKKNFQPTFLQGIC